MRIPFYLIILLFAPFILLASKPASLDAGEAELAYQLATRYVPYADSETVLDLELLVEHEAEAWWSSPAELRANREGDALPLEGLHLAIDPGHIGGVWAEWEGRNFRISDDDFWVREGELVLEVAQRVEAQLVELGAQITVLRDSYDPLNPKEPIQYWELAESQVQAPELDSLEAQIDHALAVRSRAVHLSIVVGELVERARLVNEVIRPDALISLHINAAPWPEGDELELVENDHAHVLIFGCLSARELSSPRQQEQLIRKLLNGSGPIEHELGASLGRALAGATGLPASEYSGLNAIRIDPDEPTLWARNLMLLRMVDCPTVLLEPYIVNSESGYERIQNALRLRAEEAPLADGDILIEYSDAVVRGILDAYGSVD